MPKKTKWEFGAVTVTQAHVRVWMQSVGARIPRRSWKNYIRDFQVIQKIARELDRGTFTATVAHWSDYYGTKPRAMRKPGTLARLRKVWPTAANDADQMVVSTWATKSASSAYSDSPGCKLS